MRAIVLCCFLTSSLAVLGHPAAAQSRLGEIGFTLVGRHGMAGSPCHGTDCRPRGAVVIRGETVQLRVQAPPGAPFAIGFSPIANRCARVPRVANQLVLAQPVMTVTVGNAASPDAGCYNAMGVHSLTIPTSMPSGSQFALQSWAHVPTQNGTMPTWSVGIRATVQ